MRLTAKVSEGRGLSESVIHAGALLSELAMSHGELATLLRTAINAQHPGADTYVWPRDVYDDHVVYELSTNDTTKLFQRAYAIVDGNVTLGGPVQVVAVTQYIPVEEAEREGLIERAFSQDERDRLAKSGAAMPSGEFPIVTRADLKNAIQAFGRAKDKTAVKRHILKRAMALNAADLLPEDWTEPAESDREELTGDLVPLVEKAVRTDGTIALRIIAPGQGTSGYYGAEMLKRDGPKVFTEGLHMHLDHPSISEEADRPERSVTTLAGTLASDARWEEHGAAGPGLYADAKIRADIAPLIEELAPHIGVSIRALGKASTGEVDGKPTRVIDAIEQAKSVDFVTIAGAGGRVLELVEAARQGITPAGRAAVTTTEDDGMDQEQFEEAQRQIAAQQTELDRLKEALILRDARDVVVAQLGKIDLPAPTRHRLTESLAADPPTADGALDRDALVERIKEAAKAELAYLASVNGGNPVRGMGGQPLQDEKAPAIAESAKRIEAALAGL